MAIINQSIPLQATGGGSVSLTHFNASWVKMSDNRFVVVYSQTNPTGRRFAIIDNPDGLNSETAPTVTNGVIASNDTNISADFFNPRMLKLVRVNAQVFAVVWKALGQYTNVQFEFFTILGTTITKVYNSAYQTFGWLDNSMYGSPSNSNLMMNDSDGFRAFQSPVGVANTGENGLAISFFKEARYLASGNDYIHYQTLATCRGTYNPANNTFGWGNPEYTTPTVSAQTRTYLSSSVYEYSRETFHYPDFYEVTPYGSSYQYLGYRLLNKNATLANRGSGILSQQHTNNFVGNWKTQPNFADTCYMATGRRVQAGWNSAYFYNANNERADGGAIYSPPVSPAGDDNLSPYVLPINNDWFMVIDSRHFYNVNVPLTMKVVCREDFNIVGPSTASQSQYGFTINAPVKIQVFNGNLRPFMVGQDVMWCGKPIADTGKFTYNIIKQPPLAN